MNLVLEVVGQNAQTLASERRKVFGAGGGSIGRAPECDWVLASPYISRHHATVCCINGIFYIESTGENGVAVNTPQAMLPQLERRALQSGDRLFIDEFEINVGVSGAQTSSSDALADVFGEPDSGGPSGPVEAHEAGAEALPTSSDDLDPLKKLTARIPASQVTAPRQQSWNHTPSLADHFTPPAVPQTSMPIGDDWNETDFTPSPRVKSPPSKAQPFPLPDANTGGARPAWQTTTPPHIPESPTLFGAQSPPSSSQPSWPRESQSAPHATQPPFAFGAQSSGGSVQSGWPLESHTSPHVTQPPAAYGAQSSPAGTQSGWPLDTQTASHNTQPPSTVGGQSGAQLGGPGGAQSLPSVMSPPAAYSSQVPSSAARAGLGVSLQDASQHTSQHTSLDLNSLLQNAGVDPATLSPETAAMLGRVFRSLVQGLIEVLRARAEFRNQFRLPVTRVRTTENNPLKFAINAEDALGSLLGRRNPGYMPATEAFDDAFDDVRFHQLAMIAGMRAGFEGMMNRFDPQKLQERFDRQLKTGGFLAMAAKLRYWDLYTDLFDEMAGNQDAAFHRLFGEEFASAYEKQLEALKRSRGNPRH